MEHFKLVSKYQPTGDQPQAIEALVKGFQEGAKVTCWSPALGQNVRGTVLSVTAAPDFADLKMVRERGQADLTLFKVRINVEPAEGLLTGMTLEVKL